MSKEDSIEARVFFYISIAFVMSYYLSPVIAFYHFFKKKLEWKELPILQIFGMIFNCLYWIIAGNIIEDNSYDTILWNSIGLLFGVVWGVMLWLSISLGNIKERFIYLFMGFNVIFQLGWYVTKLSHENNGFITITLASIFNVLMYLFSLQNIFSSWLNRAYTKVPIYSIASGLGASLCWMVYGLLTNQPHLIYPNAIALCILVISLCLWLYLLFTNDQWRKNKKERNEMEISSRNPSCVTGSESDSDKNEGLI